MTGIPAWCTHCKTPFLSSAISINNSMNVTIENVGVTCPKCGKIARAIDGNFDFVNDGINARNVAPQDKEILEILQAALRAALNNEDSKKVVAHLAKASPEFVKSVQDTVAKQGIPWLIIILYALLQSCSMQSNLNWNELVDQFYVYLTKSASYPIAERTDAQENTPQHPQALSRQQKRQQERRAKKQQRQSERRMQRKPKH